MQGSSNRTTMIVLTLVGVVLAGVAVTTDWPSWVIVVLFVLAAFIANVAGRRGGGD